MPLPQRTQGDAAGQGGDARDARPPVHAGPHQQVVGRGGGAGHGAEDRGHDLPVGLRGVFPGRRPAEQPALDPRAVVGRLVVDGDAAERVAHEVVLGELAAPEPPAEQQGHPQVRGPVVVMPDVAGDRVPQAFVAPSDGPHAGRGQGDDQRVDLDVAALAAGGPQGDPHTRLLVGGHVGDGGAQRHGRADPAGQRFDEPLVAGRQGVQGAVAGVVDQQVVHPEQPAGAGRLGGQIAVALHRREPRAPRVVHVAEHVFEGAPLPGVVVVPFPAGEGVVRRRAQRRALLPEPAQAVHAAASEQSREVPVVAQDAVADHEVRGPREGPRLEPQVSDQPAQLRIAGDVVQLGHPRLVAHAGLGHPGGPHPPAGAVARLPHVYLHAVAEAAFQQVRAQQSAETGADDPDPLRHRDCVPPPRAPPPAGTAQAPVPGAATGSRA